MMTHQIDDLLRPPTPKEAQTLRARGASTWGEYIADKAAENGLTIREAFKLFQALGEDEAFDGFVSACRDDA